jgi:dipeptidyl aminopeptidase/acylaminoacyl peptidase
MKRIAFALFLVATAALSGRGAAEGSGTHMHWQPSERLRLVTASDPQISPDGTTVIAIVSRANAKENRFDPELVAIDVASGAQRPLTYERRGLSTPRWSPDGTQVAFLANASADKDAKRQVWVMPFAGGEARRLTDAARGVQQFAWSPDGSQLAFVTADEPPKTDEKVLSFEVNDDDYLMREEPRASHVWLVSVKEGAPRRLTSGAWSLPVARPPGPAPSPLSWSPDGKWIAFTRRDSAHEGLPNSNRVALVEVATGNGSGSRARTSTKCSRCSRPTARASRTGIRAAASAAARMRSLSCQRTAAAERS